MKHDNRDAGKTPETDPSKRDLLKTSAGLFASAAAIMRAAKASRDYLGAATGLWKLQDILA